MRDDLPKPRAGEVILDIREVSGRRFLTPLISAALLASLAVGALVRWQNHQTAATARPQTGGVAAAPSPAERPGWTLTFADEFGGDTLDTSRWLDSYPNGERTHSNNEQQYYAPYGATVRDGYLCFTAERRSEGGMPYTSGMVSSYGKFAQQYGRFEIRARFPKGKGLWPAFWLLPETRAWPPEIDVVEIVGHKPNEALLSHHWRESGAGGRRHVWQTKTFTGPDFCAEDFHTFAVEWGPDEIVWYVDDVERHRATHNVPREPMYVLANLAVGGDLPGMPDETTPFPAVMEVDYIRVYQRLP
jgi:Beta-glucanase/Beta-glucan synthetase